MLLLCYDGSDDARGAIDAASDLVPGGAVTVLSVWEPFVVLMTQHTFGPGFVTYVPSADEVDEDSARSANSRAEEGAAYARAAGLNAQPRVASFTTTIADAILEQARAVDATAIVMGTRGLTGLKSALLGSVSHAVLQHADRTVVIVPSPIVAQARGKRNQ